MHETDALPLNVNHTTIYAHWIFACYAPTMRKCANTENTSMTTELIVI